ncbi:GGDEF domain-containing protein [Lysobacter solisilvae (ex Woo and Kim 2020)]|uniref:diguanylate cyclase n=1 Tax=Agrilutibacter terrestris TaxID=2865112 RepID=A0A7H0FUW3_9GAMM|nr:GGDEF domain-containing protein [Lysobacter terrestris]QNP39829.1 GGDEF domain-containing protein [Lysobacter terrestris]
MQALVRQIRDTLRLLFAQPDEVMREVGSGGELIAARVRAVIALLLLVLPLINAASGGSIRETMIGLGGAVFVNVFAQVWLALARRHRQHRWLPFASSAFDVTAATLVLAMLAMNHLPSGLNSMVVWCGYLLALVLTALRGDARVTLFAGGLALFEYSALAFVAIASATSPEQLISADYGAVTIGTQAQRVVLLAITTLITVMVTFRMQRVVEMSGTDGLTGLPNRVWLLHRVPRVMDTVQRDGSSLSLALIDLDHFKRVNDEAGHRAGDRALKHVVSILREGAEPGENLVRIGGQEFVLLMRKPIGSAWERVEHLRRQLLQRPFEPERGGEPFRLSLSAGIATYPQEGADLSRLLRRADQRLQEAKREGRNRVVARDG